MAQEKVVRLRPTQCDEILEDILQDSLDDKLDALVIIAKRGDILTRYFFDNNGSCITCLGLIEAMKKYVFDWIDENQGDDE